MKQTASGINQNSSKITETREMRYYETRWKCIRRDLENKRKIVTQN